MIFFFVCVPHFLFFTFLFSRLQSGKWVILFLPNLFESPDTLGRKFIYYYYWTWLDEEDDYSIRRTTTPLRERHFRALSIYPPFPLVGLTLLLSWPPVDLFVNAHYIGEGWRYCSDWMQLSQPVNLELHRVMGLHRCWVFGRLLLAKKEPRSSNSVDSCVSDPWVPVQG
jgi:hypothetical protein